MYKQFGPKSNNIQFTNINNYQNANDQQKDLYIKNNNNLTRNDKCLKHQEPFIKYCSKCTIDLCQYCELSHSNHLLINYEDIAPDDDEINLLKNTIKCINEDYSKLLEEITKWKKILEEKIFYFERIIEKNEIINDIDFVNNYNNFKKNYLTIMKFRNIFSSVVSPEKAIKNNNIMKIACSDSKYNMGYYNYYQYNISKALLEELINNNEYNNDNNFIYQGNLIIKYLWDTYLKTNDNNKGRDLKNNNNKIINMRNSKSYYSTGTYNGPLRLDKDDDNYFKDRIKDRNYSNKQSKIIEKHIDLKKGSKNKIKQNSNLNNSSFTNSSQINNINNIFMKKNSNINNFIDNNNDNISEKTTTFNNKTLATSYSSQSLFSNTTFNNNNNKNISTNNIQKNKIYEKLISCSPMILNADNNINEKKNQRVYSKKRCSFIYSNINNNKLNQTTYNINNPFDLKGDEDNNILNYSCMNNNINNNSNNNSNNNIISINIPKKNKYMGRSNSLKIVNNTFNPDRISNNILTSNNSTNNINNREKQKEVITSKYIPEIRTRNLIYNKNNNNNSLNNSFSNNANTSVNNYINSEKVNKTKKIYINNLNNINNINNNNQGKTFKHKKFGQNFEVIKNIDNDQDKLNQTQLYNKLGENFQEDQLNDSNILNNTFTQSYPSNYSNIQKNIIIFKKENKNDTNIHFLTNAENNQIKSTVLKNNQKSDSGSFRIVKNNPESKYLIDPNKPLCIGLDLDNSECKISLVNQTTGDIELFCFEKDQYSIPTIISFNDKNEIVIGNESELISITNPSQTIFNLLKMVGKNYNEIKGMKEIWPFKVHGDEENGRPYITINFVKKEKKFYSEDLLNLFLKKLFEIFFSKIVVDENSDRSSKDKVILNIILVVTVPNTLNYLQRKVIEKIFIRQIFPEIKLDINNDSINNITNKKNISLSLNSNDSNTSTSKKRKLYNDYIVQLKKIKIENSSSIASLCLKGSKNNKLKDNNCLIVNMGGGSINLSITSINSNKEKKSFDVKALNGAEFGEEDFIDNFVYSLLKEFDEKMYKECLMTPGALAKLHRSCSIAKKCFEKTSQIEIKVSKLYENIDLKIILNKTDYEKASSELYKKINLLIKEILKKAKLSEINIDNILLIGSSSRTDKIKNILRELFKHNRLLYNKLALSILSESDNDFYSVIGAAIQANNLIANEPKYKLNDITPMSFGVETINGLMEFIIEKDTDIPVQKEKFVKIRNDDGQFIGIKIYEGEDNKVIKNRLISSANIDKKNFKAEKVGKNYIEILIQFEIDSNLNLYVYVLDVKTYKRRFECLINIDIVKS